MNETFDYDQKVLGKDEVFDYNEVFMGVTHGKKGNYFISFEEDYRLKHLTDAVKAKSGKLVDLGCGGGLLTESLAYYYPKVKVFGCDVSRTAISYAKKFGSGKVNYDLIKNKKLPYKDNSFDVCICLDVLEHIPDVDYFLKEVKRILKNNGKFFLVIPCEGQPFTYTWFFQKLKMGDKLTFKNWGHIHPEFTHKSVTKLLETHGFSVLGKTYSEHIFHQLLNFFTYFLPKEILEFILKQNATKYYDRGIVEKVVKNDRKTDILDVIRETWLFIGTILSRLVITLDVLLLKRIPFTAWKINLYTVVNK